ncbi:hypothetical protein OVA24_04935 [Luteolibacter sp. SL250]|uniref:hypothetical protein n=1 Tax=Luteolibacter sp. SL250 TaxID=2995170 RepID=UPI00227145BE|nr:hypothetical protein [Luteolibacter sp. SL250]WAC20725.1 hypothetical protein OVA24_04935 [Luteolibacter sp. SL250]
MNSIEKLKAARNGLLKLHRELITSERAVYEHAAGPIPSAGAFLQLLAHDPWFEWLQPFTRLIARVDDALFDKKVPITDERAEALIGEIRALLEADAKDGGFGTTYAETLRRDPHVLATHAEVRRVLGA